MRYLTGRRRLCGNWLKSKTAAAVTISDAARARWQAQFAQIAMIIEAAMLGYSLSRRR
jgi:hypothetical protein